MLRILGSQKKLCDDISRREMLVSGALSFTGLSLADLLEAQAEQGSPNDVTRPSSFGRAKSCILLYLWGSPSQLETFDVKPDAPIEVRGEYGDGIASSIPGYRVGELLPRVARVVDRTTTSLSRTNPWLKDGMEKIEDEHSSTTRAWMLRAAMDKAYTALSREESMTDEMPVTQK